MANFGQIETMLNGLEEPQQKTVFKRVFEYLLANLRFGRADDGEAAVNFGGGFFQGKTDAVANTEFTIAHTFGRAPYLLMPVLPLNVIGAQVVRLKVTKAADSTRIYLSSPDTSATFRVYLEG